MSTSRRTGARVTRRLAFVCTDNVNVNTSGMRRTQVLLVWDDGSFALYVDDIQTWMSHEDYPALTKQEWVEKGWRTVIEL